MFDSLLKLRVFLKKPDLLDWFDEIEAEVLRWEGTTLSLHQYGGVQFNHNGKEIGHLHGYDQVEKKIATRKPYTAQSVSP